jgi:DNA invertase Pin-like site-specific DNA recombinase
VCAGSCWLPGLDRLGSTRDLLNVLATVTDKGAGFKSVADAWAETTTPHGQLMLTVFGGLAEFERELIRARTDEGRKRAQARGVRFGRRLKLSHIKSLRPYSVGMRERHWLRLVTLQREPFDNC